MKHKNKYISILFISIVLIIINIACSEDTPTGIDTEKNAANIQEYISKLSYNSEALLNYQNTGGEESVKELIEDTSETNIDGNFTTICRTTTHNLKKNYDRVAILRPTTGIVWTGALVKGNESLLDGVPRAYWN